MTDNKPMMLYTATYGSVSAAMTDLDAIEQLHKDQAIGTYDAAVIDQENGKPHVAKRMDRPSVRVVPEWFGGGTLPRKELHEAAQELTGAQAGLVAVGEPTIEQAVDKALTSATAATSIPIGEGSHTEASQSRRRGGPAGNTCHARSRQTPIQLNDPENISYLVKN